MGPTVRHLAIYSQHVYENTIVQHFSDEFQKQEKIQKLKFALLAFGFTSLAALAVVVPLYLSRFLKYLLV